MTRPGPCDECGGEGRFSRHVECHRCHGSGVARLPLRCYCCGMRSRARLCTRCLLGRCPLQLAHVNVSMRVPVLMVEVAALEDVL